MKPFLSILLLLCTFICRADRFLNLGFELMAYGSTTPMSWDIGGNGYTIVPDSSVKYNGKYSLRMEGAGATKNDYAHCSGVLLPTKLKGKKLLISGFVKTADIIDGNATLYAMVYGRKGMLKYADNKNGPSGTNDWKRFSVEIPISEESTLISFGCAMTGKGSAWFDDLQVYINDNCWMIMPTCPGNQTPVN